MEPNKLIILIGMLAISWITYSQCPTNFGTNATVTAADSPCSVTGNPVRQGFALGTQSLTIEVDATLTINGDFEVYDNLIIYGTLIVNGDVSVFSAGSAYVAEGGTFQINGDYDNGGLVFSGDTGVDGNMTVTGTFTNNSTGSVDVGDNATMQFGDFQDNGGTLSAPEGEEGCENGGCCGGGCASLPIQLLSFSATEWNGNALLEWKTGSEIDNDHFEIQKATFSNPTFSTIGMIEGNGTTTDTQHYSFVDEDFREDSYYRLVQYDFDGQNENFKMKTLIKSLSANELEDIHIYPNPSPGNITISGAAFTSYQIFDHTGKLLWAENQTIPQLAQQNINQILETRRGTFFLIFYNKNQVFEKRIIKQ
ncbi:MAG: T9SS type A sorting domain-containing protein [Cyclobacteriaceae bacterium]